MNPNNIEKEPVVIRYKVLNLLLTILTGVLFLSVALSGICFPLRTYTTESQLGSFLPNDYINLLFGIPMLITSVILAYKKHRIGVIGWMGTLLFILYNAVAYFYALQTMFSNAINGCIMFLTIAAIYLLLRSIDYKRFSSAFKTLRRPKVYGSILIVMGLIFSGRAVLNILGSANGTLSISDAEIGVNYADVVVSVYWILGGVLFFSKNEARYFTGTVSYMHGFLLFISLIVFMIIQPIIFTGAFSIVDFLAVVAMSLVILIPFYLLFRRLKKN